MEELNPVIINVPTPNKSPFKLPKIFSSLNVKSTKIIASVAAIVIALSVVGSIAFTVVANNKKFQKSRHLGANGVIELPSQSSESQKSDAALPGGDTAVGKSVNTGTNSPVVTLTATPASVVVGKKSHLKWSVTNNPKECKASDDWSGVKAATGEEDTEVLGKVQTYIFTLTCKTDTGTGFATVSIGATDQGGSGDVLKRPTVTIAANPTSVYAGYTTTLSWDVTNNPTSCTASGDWSGAKSVNPKSFEVTAALPTVKSYSFKLTCKNAAGSGFATATVAVVNPPPDVPITTLLSSIPSPVSVGSQPRLTWSATNNPTSCTASGDWSGSKAAAGGSQTVGPLSALRNYSFIITCLNASGSTIATINTLVVPDAPVVTLSVTSSFQYVGGTANLTWSATNNPTSCTASGDWSGSKAAAGSVQISLTTVKTYFFSLVCSNAGGLYKLDNVPLNVLNPPVPVVTINVSPISISTGQSANISWSATNNPTSCTASGNAPNWTGTKATSGPQNSGTMSTAGTYNYTLVCANAGGNSSSASTSLTVTSGVGVVTAPVVTISVSPTSIGTGNSASVSWSATNNPTSCTASNNATGSGFSGSVSGSGSGSTGQMNTAGNFNFTVSCTNTAGTDTKSAILTVVAVPQATISATPNPINAGSTTTVTWSSTNSATGCTAGGTGWSGSKASAGNQVVTLASVGSFSFSIQCSNGGGAGNLASTSVTVNAASTYCVVSGVAKTPCYGVATLASHAATGNCWAWITHTTRGRWVIDVTNYAPSHKGGTKAGSLDGDATSICNHDVVNILNGLAGIAGFKDGNNATTHVHTGGAQSNNNTTLYGASMKGYYDPNNPN